MRISALPAATWIIAFLLLVAAGQATHAAQSRNVLVIYSNNRLLPANIDIDRGMHESMENIGERNVEFFAEFLDTPTFSGAPYERAFADYLQQKYGLRPPDAIVVAGKPALEFLLRQEGALFRATPVVHAAVDSSFIQSISPLPANVVGVPVHYDYQGTMAQALRWHPRAERLVIVTGASTSDRNYENEARRAAASLKTSVALEFVAGLPTDAVRKRLAELGPQDVVFTPGYYQDGAGRNFAPREAARIIAAAAKAPVYGPFSSFIGTGVVGGSMPPYSEMGRQAALAINALLEGTPPAKLHLPDEVPARIHVDWREASKWGIGGNDLPQDAIVLFRQPTFWETYRNTALLALAVMLLQGALIAALVVERQRRRSTASALHDSEQRMNLAARAARLSMWVWDVGRGKAWSITDLHPASALSKKRPADFATVLETVHPGDREAFERTVRLALERDIEVDIEYRTLDAHGVERWMAARGRADKNSTDRVTGVALDITARKTAQLQAQRDRAALTHMTRVSTMGQFSASIAHQLNQPLAAILGNAETARKMLEKDDPDLAELREICDDIVEEDKRAAAIIRRLGSLFRRGDMSLVPLDLNELAVETLELLRSELATRHITSRVQMAGALPLIRGDRVQIQQVLLNLLLNGADAMADAPPRQRALVVRTETGDGAVRLHVIDQGSGIAAADMTKLFDAFWTTKPGGTGVGLAICKSIVTAHGGTLTAFNNAGPGATFSTSWPINAQA